MLQTSIQNERSIIFANGAKVEIYVTSPYARYVDVGAISGNTSFSMNFEVFRGEIDTFQNNDSYLVTTGATLAFNGIEFRPEVIHDLMGESLSYKPTIDGAEISDFTTELLTKNIFRITGKDDYGNERKLALYNVSINNYNGLDFVGNTGTSTFQYVFDCLYDSSDRLYLLQDAAGYDYEYAAILGDPTTDFLLGDTTSDYVLGDPLSDNFTEERL